MSKINWFVLWHALIAGLFIACFGFADEDFLNIHRIFGYAILILIFIRYICGLFMNGIFAFKTPVKNENINRKFTTYSFIIMFSGLIACILTGVTADYFSIVEDFHEELGEFFVYIVGLHSVIMLIRTKIMKFIT